MTVGPVRAAVPGPGRLGLIDADAAAGLAELGWTGESHVASLWALSRAPDPDLALRTLVRLREALGPDWDGLDARLHQDARLRARLLALAGASTGLGDHLVARPHLWHRIGDQDRPTAAAQATETMLAAVDAYREEPEAGAEADAAGPVWRAGITGPEAIDALRTAYRDELAVLAAADLAATVDNEPELPLATVGAALSDLADAALSAALAVAIAQVCHGAPCPVRLAVIAMGKCGARELNYVSDVDVVLVAAPADETAARIAGELMRIGSAAFFEVDAGLRPEGRRGALVRTVDSHLTYYRRWAKTWEFQALLKARPMCGDMTLGHDYLDRISPMVWTATEREDFVAEVRTMRRRVEQQVPADLRSRELKLGRGSLRDVEFAVQLLQLVHGRTDPELHVTDTLGALAALSAGGYVGRGDAAELAESYEFLRVLEHRLQLQRLQRTHTLPADDDTEALRWLARAARVRPGADGDVVAALRRKIRRHSTRIRRLHEELFYRPLLESVAGLDADTVRLGPVAAKRRLAALGYRSPGTALGHLQALTAGGTRKGRIQALLLPTLMVWLGETPDPDGGLLAYRRLSEEMTDRVWFLRTLRDEGVVAKRLMTVLGSSALVTGLLLTSPAVIRLFADDTVGPKLTAIDPADVAGGLRRSAARHPDPERAVAAARSLRRRELARIAAADLLGMAEVTAVCAGLTHIWCAVLDAAVAAVIRAKVAAEGPAPARLAVIGMGRLGGGELGYGSDADVLFVCDPVPAPGAAEVDADREEVALRWCAEVAEQVRTLLGRPSTDPPLEVDIDLRPEGRTGPMVRTCESYLAYYRAWAEPWEIQALLRAAPVAGDPDLGERFIAGIDPLRYRPGGLAQKDEREILRVKARVDAERLPRGADPATHTKLGRGGLADVEWAVQLLTLRHAHDHPGLRTASTLVALAEIETAGLLGADDAARLREAWLLATRARNAIVLVRGRAADQLPEPGEQLGAVAYAAGWRGDDDGAFLDHYLKVTRRARTVVEQIFGGRPAE